MQRITLAFLIFLVSSAFSSTSSQTQIKNLNEYKAKPRVFKPIGCKYTDVPGQECQHKVLVNNYDMEPSIARSDTFDINHYDVDLDVTKYNEQFIKRLGNFQKDLGWRHLWGSLWWKWLWWQVDPSVLSASPM